ncbi:hypothetical protein [Thalassococcus sp. S3]|uniref:hypothetical protein n=1 Tax=Thalassococcus sp. S3 TaxID=2017482 RepID=UPI001024012C|nr:hypothetical protein [Thalassococcus sp. S3]QBF30199.1 hypothetical protein CFI11_03065 [Thalassococcus sp. S3]
MRLATSRPLSPLYLPHWSLDDDEVGVVVANVRFSPYEDSWFYVSPEAPKLILADRLAGDPVTPASEAEHDMARAKSESDLSLRQTACALGAAAPFDGPVELGVTDAY